VSINPGKLRNKITIQSNTTSKGTYGGIDNSWATFTTAWAAIKWLGGGMELMGNDQVRGERRAKFTTRYQSGITTAMRISFDSRIWDIETVINVDELGKYVEIQGLEKYV